MDELILNYNNPWLKGLLVAAGIGLRCTAMRADRLNATPFYPIPCFWDILNPETRLLSSVRDNNRSH
jgi:hypothetical protein